MMRNVRMIATCGVALVFLSATLAQAQDRRPDNSRGGSGSLVERVLKELDLNDRQREKVKDSFAAHDKRMREVLEKSVGGATREMMAKLHSELMNELKGTL